MRSARPGDPTEAVRPSWPPRGTPVKLPVTRDVWVSWAKGERKGNNGGSSRLKAKGCQEYSIFDVDASSLKGKIVTGALWHFHSASPKAPFLRVTVSTVATPWTEGTSSGYREQPGSACFEEAQLGKRAWAYPGSTLFDAAFGKGHTIWRFAESSPQDAKGWQSVAVEPDVVAARAAGLSEGFAIYDDVGSIWNMEGAKFTWTYFPNRFIHSREQDNAAPWLEVWTEGEDREPPEAVTGITCETAGLPAGEAIVGWKTPRDRGAGKTLGFDVTYAAGGRKAKMPRYLVPMARLAGEEVVMHIQDLPFKPGEEVLLAVSPVDSAGNVGREFTKTITLSDTPPAFGIAPADVKPFEPSTALPEVGGLRVAVVDMLDKIHPTTGEMIPKHAPGYKGGNHIWSAKRRLVRLHCARNEAVCFQVNLEGGPATPRGGATVGLGLTFEGGPGLETKVFRFDYVGTKAGPMPDALVPLEGPIAIPFRDDPEAAGQKNASFLCEMYVPLDTRAGTRKGRLTISAGGRSLDIDVELEVWEFTLPDKLSYIPEMNCYGTAGPTGGGLAYYRLAHEHRTCLNRLYYNWRGQPSHEPPVRGDGFDWSKWDREFGPLFDGSAFRDLPRKGEPVDLFYLPFNETWPVDIHSNYMKSYWVEEALTADYKEKLKRAFARFAGHLDKMRWHDTVFQFYLNNKVYNKKDRGWRGCSAPWIFDEPSNTQDFWALRWYGVLFHQAVDPVRGKARMWYRGDISRSSFARDMFWGVMDMEVMGGANAQKVRQKRDEQVLWDENYFTQYGSANDPADSNTQPAVWCLATWSDGAVGCLPWQTIGKQGSWAKGEKTCLFYPPRQRGEGPLPSVRLKAFRRGQQMVEYLTLLGLAYGQPHFAVAGGVNRIIDLRGKVMKTSEADAGTIRFSGSDPAGLWELRYRVGKMVAAKRPAYKRCLRPMPSPRTDMTRLPDIGYVTVGPIAPKPRPAKGGYPQVTTGEAVPALPAAAAPQGKGWQSIFNGRDLTGWRSAGKAYAGNGALVSENGGDVFYSASWTEFALSCDVKTSGGMQRMGMSLGHPRMGRGGGRVTLVFHGDGDVHVRDSKGQLGKSGAAKFPVDGWLPVRFELTRSTLRLYKGDELVKAIDVSRAPVKPGGVYFYSRSGGRAEIRNVRVRPLGR